jgi:hypothetical protein
MGNLVLKIDTGSLHYCHFPFLPCVLMQQQKEAHGLMLVLSDLKDMLLIYLKVL